MKLRGSEKIFFGFKIFVILIFIVFVLNFANSQNATFTGHATDEGFVDKLFTNWSSGNLDVNIAKYILFGIISLVLFFILRSAKIPENFLLQGFLAVVVGFLVTAYINPQEILTFLATFIFFTTRDLIVISVIFVIAIIVGIYLWKKSSKEKDKFASENI